MPNWLDSIPNLRVPGVPGVLPQKTAGAHGTRAKCEGVPGVQPEHLAISVNPQKSAMEHREHREHLISEMVARKLLDEWHCYLAALDLHRVPEGFSLNRWAKLVEDCWWLYETHCSALVRDGWSALDLFGVFPMQAGWGGLADQVQGARTVAFDDTGRARWTRLGVKFWTVRGACEGLGVCDIRLVWDCKTQP